MASDILLASQGGTCAVIHTTCCTFISDESGNITSLLSDMKSQIQNIRDASAYAKEIPRSPTGFQAYFLGFLKAFGLSFLEHFSFCSLY